MLLHELHIIYFPSDKASQVLPVFLEVICSSFNFLAFSAAQPFRLTLNAKIAVFFFVANSADAVEITLIFSHYHSLSTTLSPLACNVRRLGAGGGLPDVATKIQNFLYPPTFETLHPRLRQTACYVLAFVISILSTTF